MSGRIGVVLVLLTISACRRPDVSASSTSKAIFTATLPAGSPVKSSMRCSGVSQSTIGQDPADVTAGRVVGKMNGASDTLAVTIGPSHFRVITVAAVEAGVSEASDFDIVRDSVDYLMGTHITIGRSLHTFVLNRKNGFAVWTMSRPSFLTIATPDTTTVYLSCQ